MTDFERNGKGQQGQLVHLVQHDKENEVEVELLAEDRYYTYFLTPGRWSWEEKQLKTFSTKCTTG
jgi:hypothetical protein